VTRGAEMSVKPIMDAIKNSGEKKSKIRETLFKTSITGKAGTNDVLQLVLSIIGLVKVDKVLVKQLVYGAQAGDFTIEELNLALKSVGSDVRIKNSILVAIKVLRKQ